VREAPAKKAQLTKRGYKFVAAVIPVYGHPSVSFEWVEHLFAESFELATVTCIHIKVFVHVHVDHVGAARIIYTKVVEKTQRYR
jgi:hypothetical protein